MKLDVKSLLATAATIAGTVHPGIAGAIAAVNMFLPDDKKLPATATGGEVDTAIKTLPPEQQQIVYCKEIDLDIAKVESWADIQKSHAVADASGSSTRPNIALMMAWAVLLSIIPVAWAVAYAICMSPDPLAAAGDNYLLILALVGTPTVLLRAYFGMRSEEKKSRYAASVGQQVHATPANVLGRLFK